MLYQAHTWERGLVSADKLPSLKKVHNVLVHYIIRNALIEQSITIVTKLLLLPFCCFALQPFQPGKGPLFFENLLKFLVTGLYMHVKDYILKTYCYCTCLAPVALKCVGFGVLHAL